MSLTGMVVALPCCTTIQSASKRRRERPSTNTKSKPQEQKSIGTNITTEKNSIGFGSSSVKGPVWQCVKNCGACCKLNKGPAFPSPDEIFDDPSDVQLYNSLIGEDGWCIHYEKGTRKCSIYADRPYFCRVEPETFEALYGIDKKKFNKEACGSCIDTIKAVYGLDSVELDAYSRAIWSSSSK